MARLNLAPTTQPATSAIDLRDWHTAEAAIGQNLAGASAALARLDERLLLHPKREALIARLAMLEVCDLSWIDGADIPIERLALYRVARTGGGEGDARGLLRADWAVRRLCRHDVKLSNRNTLIAFLGLTLSANPDDTFIDLIDRALGSLFVSELEEWLGIQANAAELHPLTRAALGFQFWRFLELSRGPDLIEPAVIAARLGAGGLEALPFAPIAYRNRRALANLGPHPKERLPLWIARVEASSSAARTMLDRLDGWELRAREATAGMSGRTPARLIEVLIAHPVVSTKMLAEEGGVSPASALRALVRFEEIGLTREVTGGGRFRFWRASVQQR